MLAEDGTVAGIALPAGRVVVVSPHLDDAALSLGGLIAAATRRFRHVTVLSVLAGDPASRLPAGGWDRRAGFETEGEAARGRREEDRRACAILGAEPVWLPYPDSQYSRPRDETEIAAAVGSALAGAAAALLPGAPLSHRDHAWVTDLLLGCRLPVRVGLYTEQPYASRAPESFRRPEIESLGDRTVKWTRATPSFADRWRKVGAIRCYRTQLPMLGLSQRSYVGLARLLPAGSRSGLEEVGWVDEED